MVSPSSPGRRVSRTQAAGRRGPAAVEEWTDAELVEIRDALLADLARLEADLAAAEQDMAGLIADSGDGAGDDQADTGSKTFEREHEMSVTANTRELLDQSNKALKRLEDGTYGICEFCGGPISKGRLRAFPRATLCIDCKQREERR
jgi:DnaK suppressor protein